VDEFLSVLRGLGDASGWVVAVTVLLTGIYAIATGKLVPGYVYQREVARGDRAEDAVEAAQKSTEQAAAATKAATDASISVANQLLQLQDAVARSRESSR
jgi:hypothetical protein